MTENAAPHAGSAQRRDSLAPRDVVEGFLGSLHDLELAASFLAENVCYENVGTVPLPTMRSRRAAVRLLAAVFAIGTGFRVDLRRIVVSGDVVMTERVDMIMFGDTPGRFWVCGVFVVRDGQIVEWREYFDTWNVLSGIARGAALGAWRRVFRRR